MGCKEISEANHRPSITRTDSALEQKLKIPNILVSSKKLCWSSINIIITHVIYYYDITRDVVDDLILEAVRRHHTSSGGGLYTVLVPAVFWNYKFSPWSCIYRKEPQSLVSFIHSRIERAPIVKSSAKDCEKYTNNNLVGLGDQSFSW